MFQYSRDNGFIVGVMFRSKSTWSSQARRDKQGKISGKHLKKCGKPNDSHPDWVYYRVYPWVMGWFEIPPKWLDVLGEWDGLLAAHSQRQQTLHASQLHVFAYRSCFLSFFIFLPRFLQQLDQISFSPGECWRDPNFWTWWPGPQRPPGSRFKRSQPLGHLWPLRWHWCFTLESLGTSRDGFRCWVLFNTDDCGTRVPRSLWLWPLWIIWE